jgi:hypothetical protein
MKRIRFIQIVGITMIIAGLTTAIFFLEGCDGCSCVKGKVGGDVNIQASKTAGSAVITLTQLNKIVAPGEKKFVTVSFSGVQSGDAGGTGDASFTKSLNIQVTEDNVTPAPILHRYNLKPGDWMITISAGTWTTSCTKAIVADQSTSFTFNYNQQGCP